MELDVKITGSDELKKTLLKLEPSMRKKVLNGALRKGALVVRDAASENVKAITSEEATGLLARSIVARKLKNLRGNLRYAVQVKKGLLTDKGVRVGLYAAVLEYGKKNQPPRSWIRKAAREKPAAALAAIAEETKKKLDLAVKDAKQ